MKKIIILTFAFVKLITLCNAQTWTSVGGGANEEVFALANYKGLLYAGSVYPGIHAWNGSIWNAVGSGVYGGVYVLDSAFGNLYVGGEFDSAGGILAKSIAQWNGTSWSNLGSGVTLYWSYFSHSYSGYVYSLTEYNGKIYAAGMFDTAGGIPVHNIAEWNGSSWSALGQGVNGTAYAMAVYNGNLYVGGAFDSAGGQKAGGIAMWNGATWSAVGAGSHQDVYSLCVYNGNLYLGGFFDRGDDSIVEYNGNVLSPVGTGITGFYRYRIGNIWALTVYDNHLVVGGYFDSAGGKKTKAIAAWNGSSWSNIGNGVDTNVYALCGYNGYLYAGGSFDTAGGNSIKYIARWGGPLAVNEILPQQRELNVYPNPNNGEFVIQNSESEIKNSVVEIYNLLGEKVFETKLAATDNRINISDQPAGIYLYRVISENGTPISEGKFVIEK